MYISPLLKKSLGMVQILLNIPIFLEFVIHFVFVVSDVMKSELPLESEKNKRRANFLFGFFI